MKLVTYRFDGHVRVGKTDGEAAMQPPQFLKHGDIVRVEIDGIGAIENRVETER